MLFLFYNACCNLIDLVWAGSNQPELQGKVCQMPSGKFHYYLCAKLNADAICQMMESSIVIAKIPYSYTLTLMWYLAVKLTARHYALGVERPISM